MIEISDTAKSKIREILDNNPGKYLRIIVEGTGCGGPYLELSLDEANSNEQTIRVNGIDILVSDDVIRYAEKTTVNIFMNHAGKDLL
jgi:Fe-S cluster assembly iron-binding protein IscA